MSGVDDKIWNATQLCVPDRKDLVLTVAMTMAEAGVKAGDTISLLQQEQGASL